MSRTFRTNKYGKIKTDKFVKNFNGCGCVYCEWLAKDFRNDLKEKIANKEIEDEINNRYSEYYDNTDEYDEEYYHNTLSDYIMIYNDSCS